MPVNPEKAKTSVQIWIPVELHKRLRHLTIDLDVTLPDLIRRFVEEGLARETAST